MLVPVGLRCLRFELLDVVGFQWDYASWCAGQKVIFNVVSSKLLVLVVRRRISRHVMLMFLRHARDLLKSFIKSRSFFSINGYLTFLPF